MIRPFIPYGKQSIDQQDIDAVYEVLKSDFLTQGQLVGQFEEQISSSVGSKYASAFNSATSALHCACLALGLGAGDILWTSPISFVASSNCALYCGATVDFVDIDPGTRNMCMDQLELKLEDAKKMGSLPKIVVAVHFSGEPCELVRLQALARQFGFKVIEDASHALGAEYDGVRIGDGNFGDVTVFSFHPVKIITTAEGGVATTNLASVKERLDLYKSHGVTRDSKLFESHDQGAWYYEQVGLGFNYRLNEIQAALGISQLRRLDEFLRRRHEICAVYDLELRSLDLQLPIRSASNFSSNHLYCVEIATPEKRRHVFDGMRADGIGVNVHYIPIHLQPYYRNLGFSAGMFPNSESYYTGALTLPVHAGLSDSDQQFVIETLRKYLDG